MICYKNIVDVAPLNMNSSTVRDKYEKKQINYNTWTRQHGSPQEIHPKIYIFFSFGKMSKEICKEGKSSRI